MITFNPSTSSRARPNPFPGAFAFTLQHASRLSGLSVATLRRRARGKELDLFKIGGRTLVRGTSLRRLLGVDAAEREEAGQ
jgi:hypothetical protein